VTGTSVAAFEPQADPGRLPFVKLRPGPGRSANEVHGHQRGRLNRAVIEAVAELGYDAVTVRRVATAAGVSTRTFYQHHSSLDHCLESGYALVVNELLSELDRARVGASGGEASARRLIEAFVAKLTGDPQAARLMLVEAESAGPAMAVEAQRAIRLLGERIAIGIGFDTGGSKLPPLLVDGLGTGVLGVARSHLLGERLAELSSPGLVGALASWALAHHDSSAAQLHELDRLVNRRAAEATLAAPVSSSNADPAGGEGAAASGERSLLLTAALKLAAGGAGSLNVASISSTAGLSKRAFCRHFPSVDDCLVEALETRSSTAFARAERNAVAGATPSRRAYRVVSSLYADLAGGHALSGASLSGLRLAGRRGADARERLTAHVARLLGRASGLPANGGVASVASAAALWSAIEAHGADRGAAAFDRTPHTGALAYLALVPLFGNADAIAAVRDENTSGEA
jgi:AcrR family transcriptional regulator